MAFTKRGISSRRRPATHPLSHPQPPLHRLETHSHRVHHLLYLITFLLLVLVLIVFFSFPLFNTDSSRNSSAVPLSLLIDSLSCQWQQDHYTVCETISWGGEGTLFAKGYIPGGESMEQSQPQTASPFTYCQPVGNDDGYRVARALLFTSSGLQRDIGQGVACIGKPAPQPVLQEPSSRLASYSTTTGFRTQNVGGASYPRGSGAFTKTFPGIVRSCTFSGTWVTDNLYFHRQQTNECHRAQGIFNGSADFYEQYVINDPDLFRWAGSSQALLNPPAQRYDGYSFWMETCDNEYYSSRHTPRYGVTGRITGFGTNTLSFTWDYYDEDNKPAVDFGFTLDCQMESPRA